MKVKVVKGFKDKHTGEKYQRGRVLNITEKRYNEILLKGKLVQKVGAEGEGKPEGDGAANTPTNDEKAAETATEGEESHSDGYDIMSVAELKEYADRAYKLAFKSGTKRAEIIDTLRRMEKKEVKANG